jgi:hypothetical protein
MFCIVTKYKVPCAGTAWKEAQNTEKEKGDCSAKPRGQALASVRTTGPGPHKAFPGAAPNKLTSRCYNTEEWLGSCVFMSAQKAFVRIER